MAQESLLQKDFKERDIARVRNLASKNFQAKTVDGIGYQKTYTAYEEGDIWEDNGRTWTIKDGVRQNITKLDAAKKALHMPLRCPKCGGPMKHWMAQKIYKIHGFCFDPCTVEYEAELRRLGLFEAYEQSMIKGGLRAFLKDMESYILEGLNTVDTFVTEQGDVEDWNSNSEKTKIEVTNKLQEFLLHAKKHLQD